MCDGNNECWKSWTIHIRQTNFRATVGGIWLQCVSALWKSEKYRNFEKQQNEKTSSCSHTRKNYDTEEMWSLSRFDSSVRGCNYHDKKGLGFKNNKKSLKFSGETRILVGKVSGFSFLAYLQNSFSYFDLRVAKRTTMTKTPESDDDDNNNETSGEWKRKKSSAQHSVQSENELLCLKKVWQLWWKKGGIYKEN